MLYLVIFAIGVIVYMSMRNSEIVQPQPSPQSRDSGNKQPESRDNDMGRTLGAVTGLVGAVVSTVTGATATTTATAAAASTTATAAATKTGGATAGGTASAAGAKAAITGVAAVPSTGMLVMVGVIALAYIIARISNSVMAANKLYKSRFQNLANIVRVFRENDADELMLLKALAARYNVEYEENTVTDTSMDWTSYIGDDATSNERLNHIGFRPTFTAKFAPPPSQTAYNANVRLLDGSTQAIKAEFVPTDTKKIEFYREAAIVCTAVREMHLAFAIQATRFLSPDYFDPAIPFVMNAYDKEEIPRTIEERFYNRPFVWTQYTQAPDVSSEVYEPARGRGRLLAWCQAMRLAQFDPVIWLAWDAHTYPSYFLNTSLNSPDGDSQFIRRMPGYNQPNQPKSSRAVILKGASIGIENDVSFDLWDLRTGVGGIEIL